MAWCPECNADVGETLEMGDPATAAQGMNAAKMVRMCAAKGHRLPVVQAPPPPPPVDNVVALPARPRTPLQQPARARTAEEIVAEARAQLAELEITIPSLEADLARARAHRKGLARMVAAYERSSKE